MLDEYHSNPLLKEVPTHLFTFEEKIFGMSLPQLLSDVGGSLMLCAIMGGLPLIPRILLSSLSILCLLVLVHARVQGYTMVFWLYLFARFQMIPTKALWRSRMQAQQKGDPPSIQDTWLQIDSLQRGVMGHRVFTKDARPSVISYWVAFRVENAQHIRFLSEQDQIRFYGRVKAFLDGLGFPLKFLFCVEQSDPAHDPALLAQKQAAAILENSHPRLHIVQQVSIAVQQKHMQYCTKKAHYVIVSANSRELGAARATSVLRSPLDMVISLVRPKKERTVTSGQVLDQLRIRVSVIQKAFVALDAHAHLLDDAPFLQAYASCLALGAQIPSYVVEWAEGAVPASIPIPTHEGTAANPASPSLLPQPIRASSEPSIRNTWRLTTLHRPIVYTSANHKLAHAIEEGRLHLADLVAPTSVRIARDAVEITARGTTRYQRYFEVTGFCSSLLCGWLEELTDLGLPMIVMLRCEPLDTRMMIKKFEFQLTRLESTRITNQKQQRLFKADQQIEAEQIRQIVDALARRKLKIFAVQMVIGIHAGSKERLEQHSDYLLSHLSDMELTARALSRRHDLAWKMCLPSCVEGGLDYFTNLPSDTLSSFINWSSSTVGTPTGAYLGTTETGLSKCPVYLNPWDPTKRLANPHVTICGESGMGKSWLVKLIILGLLCNGIADAVVMDKDGDYDLIHEFLGPGESQRFDLAGVIPINLLDIPYTPADVNFEEKIDLLAEFIDNHLLVGLSLLYGETLNKSQEAFLTAVARDAYARRGITMEAIWRQPDTLLLSPPTFSDFLQVMRTLPASSESMRLALLERFENVAYLFPGQTSVQLDKPLTIFNINRLDEKWYPLMVYVIQVFLLRHRALSRDGRYLAYVIEEASYMLKHAAGKRYLESGSRGFRKRGIAQFVVSQHPADFLEEGQVILTNSATNIFLGMQRHAVEKIGLAEELARVLEEAVSGQAVMRCGREYAALDVTRGSSLHQAILTTDPVERRKLGKQQPDHVILHQSNAHRADIGEKGDPIHE